MTVSPPEAVIVAERGDGFTIIGCSGTGFALNGAAHNFTMPRVTFQPLTSVDPP
jgi:hypothetical protein